MSDYAIQVNHVSKLYKLYDRNLSRVRDALGFHGKTPFYREHYALHDMNFSIEKGECVGIIGTNGAGKSTILKIITGVLSPSEGEVIIDGRISALLELGAGFNQEYTGIENIYLNGTMIGFTREEIDAKMEDILSFADIGEFVYQPVKTYSSGMFVRLAFAVAINIEPEILIVDEALSVGDVFFQAKCYRKFEEFKHAGKTIVFVSHDLSSIQKYCDRAILLNKGRKMSEGTPKEIIDLYKKVLVHQVDDEGNAVGEFVEHKTSNEEVWKSHFKINPSLNEYGEGVAEIVDFAIRDENGTLTSTITKGTRFSICSKVLFHEDVVDPIFTYSFKNVQGVTITGSNTMFEHVLLEKAEAGATYVATFSQEMSMQGGEYLLSISCTGYQGGEFKAYHRLYDVLNVTVVSDKNTVGFYDMNSTTTIERVE